MPLAPALDLRDEAKSTAVHAWQSEAALIGAAMFDPASCADIFARVQPCHFFEPVHALMWEALASGPALDPVLLAEKMAPHTAFAELGGVRYLADLIDHAYTPSIDSHADAVIDAAMRRSIIALAEHATASARTPGQGEAVVAMIERSCADIAREGSTASRARHLGLTALSNLEAAMRGDFRGASTGLAGVDRVTGGIKAGDVWSIAGRTGMGKTIAAGVMARSIARDGRGVLIFSLEVPERDMQARIMADYAFGLGSRERLRFSDILQGRLSHETADMAREAAKHVATLPIQINDDGGLTIEDIRSQSLRQVRAWEKAGVTPGAILIDHLGLVKPVRKTDSKAADTSDTANELKALAKAVRCAVVAFSQINRATENRSDKRPTLGDLNWSSSIEQISDVVCLLYRQSYYDARSPDPDDRARADANEHDLELIVAKNRSGPICTTKAFIDLPSSAIRDLQDDRGMNR